MYLLSRVLGAVDRKGQMVVPIRAFSESATANAAAQLRTQALQDFITCSLVTPDGQDTGIRLSEFLLDLGIHGFQHVVDTIDVHGSDLLLPAAPSIILSR